MGVSLLRSIGVHEPTTTEGDERMKQKAVFKVDDVVVYTAAFLRSCGMYDYESANRKGIVKQVQSRKQGPDVLSVLWDDQEEVWSVLACNVILKNRMHLEPA
jgi:hypothetical protein